MKRVVSLVAILLCGFTIGVVYRQVPRSATAGITPTPQCGDLNGDMVIDIADPLHLLFFLFGEDKPPPIACAESQNTLDRITSLENAVATLSQELGQTTQELAEFRESVENPPVESVGLSLVAIQAGSFLMGTPGNPPPEQRNESPQLQVTFSQPLSMGETEITQAQYEDVMGLNPSQFDGCGDCPVENVNYYEAMVFCQRLTEREQAAGTIDTDQSFRLPTEAEWEYACRARRRATPGDVRNDLIVGFVC